MNRMKDARAIAAMVLTMVCLLGCGAGAAEGQEGTAGPSGQGGTGQQESGKSPAEGEQGEARYSVWNVYWNLEGAEAQTEELAGHIRNVNFFAAYFDQDDTVFIPQETIDFYGKNGDSYKARGWNCYLTVVNDKINADGTSALKSTDLLYRLLEKKESYQSHADSLIALAKEYRFDGLEIDYENIRKDDKLWQYFMDFTSYLYERCSEEGLLLRIVIESNINADKIPWVEGPSYSVMCYNLYGSHSGAGPKADKDFLEDIMKKMQYVPGNVDYALANGGFDWEKGGSVTGLTTKRAKELAQKYHAEVKTDGDSGVKYYAYKDEDGTSHEVWYGDQETLETWMGWLQAGGNWDYSIWRLGE